MAGGREIKTKIKSVQNTRKVTSALEMVSASKIRKAQELMKASRPYARLMHQAIGHIARANSEYQHPFMVERSEIKRVGFVIVSTDRGLCGGLNTNLFRSLIVQIRNWQDKGVEVDMVCIGQKATSYFRRLKVNMLGSVTHLGEKPQIDQLIGVIKVMLDAYIEGRIDRVSLVYNDFVYQAILENLASEHAARMVAMKSASDNATKAIGELTLIYNKARQAAITQEISEIVSGAAAV